MSNYNCKEFDQFSEKVGDHVVEELLTGICDAQWNHNDKGDGFFISDIHKHNACNHTISGVITHDGIEYGFVIDSGDWGGTVVREFGDCGIYKAPPPTMYDFVPKNPMLKEDRPELYKVYLKWKKEPWFIEKLRGYHYDRYVQPGGFIEKHYSDWVDQKGMRIAIAENQNSQ